MDEQQARAVADALAGQARQSGGGIWVVMLRRADGPLVVVSADAVWQYVSEETFDKGDAAAEILLR